MLKLLKYDWKHSAAFLLGVLAIVVIMQAALTITALARDWDEIVVYALGTMIYSLAAILTVGQCCKNYDLSLRDYHRRLLPTYPLQSVGAVMILSLLCVAVISIIALIHNFIYFDSMGRELADIVDLESLSLSNVLSITASYLWSVATLVITVLAAVTISRSIHAKMRVWIGIFSFFTLGMLLSWIENVLFGSVDGMFGIVSVQMTSTAAEGTIQLPASLQTEIAAGPLLVEVVFAAALLYLIHYLVSKKIDI
ncbi:hypothetical protein [Paenibacillus harenae]|uniref:hypothetical protein n=1 Tax=Paenibacillus harenae TaxID=306543 RepID=UPI0027901EFD|nr:hypothetical protein [Paenibacillus harenae]MDQ0060876.1 hypothetical protein [Paenibacillus harenae]